MHITFSSYEFIESQRKKHEPRYQTLERIFSKYHEMVDKLEWLKEAEKIAREERNIAESELFILRKQLA
jgi:hypothetical protein